MSEIVNPGPVLLTKLIDALVKAQSMINGASKDSLNPHFGRNYADLDSVWTACREALTSNGLAVLQTVHREKEKNELILRTTLLHVSGEQVTSDLPLILSKNDMQALGSAITYARRYGLMAIVGIAPAETQDDGTAAVASDPKKSNNPPAKPQNNNPANKGNAQAKPQNKEPIPQSLYNQITNLLGELTDKFRDKEFLKKLYDGMGISSAKDIDKVDDFTKHDWIDYLISMRKK